MYYYSLNEYLRKEFGQKLYKLSLNGNMTCPNRDGTLGSRGCIFCSRGGSGEFSSDAHLSIPEQIEQAKLKIRNKTDCKSFIAYFQPFTNTYAPVSYLREIFSAAISHPDISVLSIATRPDCLGDDVLALLNELNKIKPVWVELGLQTIHNKSAEYIRRGYDIEIYDKAVSSLKSVGIKVITHIIIGLPGETKEMAVKSAVYAGCKSDGIKLQLLHILKDTDLFEEYEKGSVDVLSLQEYIDILCSCIEHIPPAVVIHRLTGDGDKRLLKAPLWSADKKRVLNALNRTLKERNIVQGSKFRESE